MAYQVVLSFEDGVTRFIKCEATETVADAAYRARINIPLDCRDGACGVCKAFCESGTYDGGDYIEDALSDDEAEAGFCLPCQMRPESDLVLQIKTSSDIAQTAAATYKSRIASIHRHSATMVSFSLEVEGRDTLAFLPGQYVNILVPGSGETRSYSFSSGPDEDTVSFLVKLVDNGLMSSWLGQTAQVGDEVEFTGPFGSFFLRDLKRPTLLLAGGSGLAPLLSMLAKLKKTGGVSVPLPLLYGVNTNEDLTYLDQLEAYASEFANFSWEYCVADANSGAKNIGYVTALMDAPMMRNGDLDVYLCGPPPMVDAVRTHLQTLDITPQAFYYEKFVNTAKPADAPDTAYEIGEEHDFVHGASDAHFDARMALELGAVQLTMGRLTPEQLDEFRVLAVESGKGIDGERLVDAAQFTETNARFHAFLFNCTGNVHLLEAYERLEVRDFMEKILRTDGWMSGDIIGEHHALVDAFERHDLISAQAIVVAHNEHAKDTMNRAIAAAGARK